MMKSNSPPSNLPRERIFLSLGTNLGDRESILELALQQLEQSPGLCELRCSSFYETAAIGPPQPHYLNAVVQFACSLTPMKLLQHLQDLERKFGRQRDVRWGPRTLDLDILFFGHRVESWTHPLELVIPHPRAHQRRFVLEPLHELNPEWKHPVLQKTASELLVDLNDPYWVRLFPRQREKENFL